jgi:hypothetical protein
MSGICELCGLGFQPGARYTMVLAVPLPPPAAPLAAAPPDGGAVYICQALHGPAADRGPGRDRGEERTGRLQPLITLRVAHRAV